MFENKKIFVLGMARSGYEVSKVLKEHGCEVTVFDVKEQDENHVKELNNLNIKVIITTTPEDYLDETYDYIVKNPGIKLDHPVCIKANKLNIKVVSEYEVAYSYLKDIVDIIAITGSNGKTTTTTLIYEILHHHMNNVYIGGNMGYPLSSFVDKVKKGDILVIETAGHHLYNCYEFKAHISILTNLSEVHLDHFGTYDVYKNTKGKIFNNHNDNDISIYNIGDENVIEQVNKANGKKISFTSKENIKSNLYLKDNSIYYNDEKIIDTKDIIIKGNHNYENIMCAIAVAKEYNISNKEIYEVLSKFEGVEHRIEYVKTLNGVEYYNDSKATNVKSTQIALSSFNKPTILILGGYDRKHPFDDLESYLINTKLMICYGETKYRIEEFAKRINKKCIVKNNLKEAVALAHKQAKEGDVVLLSPACASWDRYKCFEDRGTEFKNIVNSLK